MKTYRSAQDIGASKYIVTFCDGIKKHSDGSHFADMRIFKSKAKRDLFIKSLQNAGFSLL